MTSRIQILDPLLANQIAAGEVVERPASVIKELIENSIDAQAQQIRVDVFKGGHKRMQVRDDGKGIEADDLALALHRHATSKIQKINDLYQINTMGFRGEALASIASVARVQLTSRTAGAAHAYTICGENGHITSPQIAAHPVGTTVDVQDLFYSVPARRKFLRSEQTEYSQIRQVIDRLALNHFNIAFSFYHNEKLILDLPRAMAPEQQRQRVAAILGEEFASATIFIQHEQAGMRLWGWLADPAYTRSQPDLQYWAVNGRFIRDKSLSHALREAYHDVLFHGRHPAYLLCLALDPAAVDVNVHPSKQEVRFRENRLVYDFVKDAVKKVLSSIKPGVPVTQAFLSERASTPAPVSYPRHVKQQNMPLMIQEITSFYQASEKETTSEYPSPVCPLGHAIAQLHDIYILAQNEAGLMIVDMHAAHERVLYEKLKQELAAGEIATQSLMMPITLKLNSAEMEQWQKNEASFQRLGLQIDRLGADSIVVRSIPVLLNGVDIQTLIRDVLTDYTHQDTSVRLEETLHELLATIACRAAVHAHRRLSVIEMNALLRAMEKNPNAGHCNHGRPTWKQMTMKELDQFFLRGQ